MWWIIVFVLPDFGKLFSSQLWQGAITIFNTGCACILVSRLYRMIPHSLCMTDILHKWVLYGWPMIVSVRLYDTIEKQTSFVLLTNVFSYTLSREYRVMINRYSRLLFTSEDRLCANLRVQEQSTNMTSQCQYLAFAWRHRSTVVTPQCQVRKDLPWRQWRNERSMIDFSGIVC